jgi:FtsP/CotA-like multicopper oxidase with cupredoxin domain
MRAIGNKKIRAWLALVVASAGLALTSSTASAAPQSIELCAKAGTLAPLPLTAPLATVPIWGFGIPTVPGNCGTATATLPGPVLNVNKGDTVTVTLRNALAAGHTLSFEIPGMTFNPGATDVASGASGTITFTASAPGTYIYQSGGDAGRQEAMGLYGALVVASATPGRAYDSATTAFDVDSGPLVLSAVDPDFNAAPDTFNTNDYLATYWLINGRAYPDTAPILATGGQKVLLRYVNAGYDNTSMMLLGMHQQVVARDANLLTNPFAADVETIPAGATEDTIATVPISAPPSANGFALYNRNLHVTTGTASDPNYSPGGMMTFIGP